MAVKKERVNVYFNSLSDKQVYRGFKQAARREGISLSRMAVRLIGKALPKRARGK